MCKILRFVGSEREVRRVLIFPTIALAASLIGLKAQDGEAQDHDAGKQHSCGTCHTAENGAGKLGSGIHQRPGQL